MKFLLCVFTSMLCPTALLEMSMGGHGWICFSLDGKYAWCHTPDLFDVKTKNCVAQLNDESSQPFASSKFIEPHFQDGKVVNMGNEFGLGRKRLSKSHGRLPGRSPS